MVSDEMLSAYLDGELDPEQSALLEQRIMNDAAVAARLAFMRRADMALRAALPPAPAAADDPVAAFVAGTPLPARFKWSRSFVRAAMLAAACAVGFMAGRALEPAEAEWTPLALSGDLTRLLNSAPSGAQERIGDSDVVIGFSMRGEHGEVCRQFQSSSPLGAAEGLACRNGDHWRLRVQAAMASPEGYAVAGAESPVDAAIAAMGDTALIEQAEEQRLIASGWR
jgi:hypothetical protein